MMYYRFSTFTTSYYFPEVTEETQFLYGLYSPYGGKLSRYYWRKFRQSPFVRSLTSIKEQRMPFPYTTIHNLIGEATMSFNMGSPGDAQKISILGYVPSTRHPFFAKFAQKPEAMRMIRHEIEVLKTLHDTSLVPDLYDSRIADDFVYLQTEYVQGHRPYDTLLNDKVVDLLISLSAFHYPDAPRPIAGELQTCLSHGDFCPWNMLVQQDGSLRMIDWEMADERVVGFDIFTWLLNVAGLVTGDIPLYHIIEKNRKHIMRYFNALNMSDYTPYLHSFVEQQMVKLQANKQKRMFKMYEELYAQL